MCWSEFVVSQNMGPVIFGVHTTCLILILPWKGTPWIAWRFLQHLCLFWLFAFLLSVNQSSFKRNAACSHFIFIQHWSCHSDLSHCYCILFFHYTIHIEYFSQNLWWLFDHDFLLYKIIANEHGAEYVLQECQAIWGPCCNKRWLGGSARTSTVSANEARQAEFVLSCAQGHNDSTTL